MGTGDAGAAGMRAWAADAHHQRCAHRCTVSQQRPTKGLASQAWEGAARSCLPLQEGGQAAAHAAPPAPRGLGQWAPWAAAPRDGCKWCPCTAPRGLPPAPATARPASPRVVRHVPLTRSLSLQLLANSKAHTSRFISANLPCNKFKNRLVNIMPYELTRVCLQPIRGVEGSDYVNASFIDGYR